MLQRNLNRTRKIVAATTAAGGPFFFAAKKFESDAELVEQRGRCHSGGFLLRIMPPSWYQSPPASSMPVAGETIPRQNPAVIRKSGLEIKNRCTKEGVIVEKLASIPKFGPEIKNRCMKQHIPRHAFHRAQKHASCLGCYLHGAGSSRFDSGGKSGC